MLRNSERAELIQAKSAVIEDCTNLLNMMINCDTELYNQHKTVFSEFIHYLTHELKIPPSRGF